jgi:hypothetical protein
MCEPKRDETDDGDARVSWLVQGEAVKSGALLQQAAGHRDVRLVKQIASDVVLVEMTAARARQFTARFGPDLIVERDRPITQIE